MGLESEGSVDEGGVSVGGVGVAVDGGGGVPWRIGSSVCTRSKKLEILRFAGTSV